MRRVLAAALAGAAVILAAGCDSTPRPAVADTARHKAPKLRGVTDEPVPSPDGNRVAVARHVGEAGYLEVGPARPGARLKVVFSSRYGCCDNIVWAPRGLIVFIANFNRVWTVDLRNGRAKRIGGFTGFHLSHDGKWLAGWNDNGPHIAGTVGVISIRGTGCRVPRRPKNASDWFAFFTSDDKLLSFNRQTVDPYRGRTVSVPFSSLKPAPKGDC